MSTPQRVRVDGVKPTEVKWGEDVLMWGTNRAELTGPLEWDEEEGMWRGTAWFPLSAIHGDVLLDPDETVSVLRWQ